MKRTNDNSTFAIIGDCVSRDLVNALNGSPTHIPTSSDRYKVERHFAFCSFAAMCSDSLFHFDYEKIHDTTWGGSPFQKKNMWMDFEKKGLEYAMEIPADYLIIDPLDCRFSLLEKDGQYVTMTPALNENKSKLDKMGLSEWKRVDPEDISDNIWKDYAEEIVNRITKKFHPSKVIINEHYGVLAYLKNAKLYNFGIDDKLRIQRYNPLIKYIVSVLKKKMQDCHVIPFLDNLVALDNHWFNLYELHYVEDYYYYGAEVIKIIINEFDRDKEEALIISKKEQYNKRILKKYIKKYS